MTQLIIATHQATHIDAPFHFLNDGLTVEQLPLSTCCGPAVLADLAHKRAREPIDVRDLTPVADSVVPGTRLILRTGWDRILPHQDYFSQFPFITLDLARWLVQQRIALLGMDLPTPNPTEWREVHTILLGAGVLLVEGLGHLERVRGSSLWFCAVPLRIRGRDGSPVRAMGLVTE